MRNISLYLQDILDAMHAIVYANPKVTFVVY
jgi:uncharacterized protein with HEPN domain